MSARERGFATRVLIAVSISAGVIVALAVFWLARALMLTAFLGVLFGLLLSSAVDVLQRWRVPRPAGTVLVLVLAGAVVWALAAWLSPVIRDQAREIRVQLPAAIDKLEAWLERTPLAAVVVGGSELAPPDDQRRPPGSPPPDEGSLKVRIAEQLRGAVRYLFPFVASTLAAISGIVLILFMAIFIAVQPDLYRRGLMHLFPHRHRRRAGEVLSEIARILQRWMAAQLVSMAVIGVVTTIVLMILRVKGAVALGVLAGLSEFIPVFGPLLSAVPALGSAFFDSPQKALYVLIAYIAIQQFESNIVMPIVMKKGIDVPPIVTILAGSVMAILFGFLGLLVAVPLAGAIMTVVKMVYVEDVVGDDLSGGSDAAARS
ncbi:MAG TPA: AI-2E family transporter [Thermoanaerobaculia bacterium]|nr:AI-2E family transporter [Thermoanaerobaculia bacterium]